MDDFRLVRIVANRLGSFGVIKLEIVMYDPMGTYPLAAGSLAGRHRGEKKYDEKRRDDGHAGHRGRRRPMAGGGLSAKGGGGMTVDGWGGVRPKRLLALFRTF